MSQQRCRICGGDGNSTKTDRIVKCSGLDSKCHQRHKNWTSQTAEWRRNRSNQIAYLAKHMREVAPYKTLLKIVKKGRVA